MISETYNIQEFLTAMVDQDYHEIRRLAENEVRMAEARSRNVKGAPEQRNRGSKEYAAQIKSLLYFTRFWSRPDSATDREFAMYKNICAALVEKEQLKPEVLDLFN